MSIILIVDDNASARETLVAMLENQDYRIELAEDGFHALQVLHQLQPEGWGIDHDISLAEVARQPAPSLHVGPQAVDPRLHRDGYRALRLGPGDAVLPEAVSGLERAHGAGTACLRGPKDLAA